MIIATLSTPTTIGLVLYEWAIVDVEFKYAAWHGFKVWVAMIVWIIPGIIFSVGGSDMSKKKHTPPSEFYKGGFVEVSKCGDCGVIADNPCYSLPCPSCKKGELFNKGLAIWDVDHWEVV